MKNLQATTYKLQAKNGFTIVEFLLYIAITAILTGAIATYLMIALNARVKNQTVAEVEQQGLQALQLITQTIRNADSINTPAASSTSSTLSLDVVDAWKDPTVFSLNNTVLHIQEGSSSTVPLSSSRVELHNLQFNNLTANNTSGTILVSFDIGHVSTTGRNEYVYNKSFRGSATIR